MSLNSSIISGVMDCKSWLGERKFGVLGVSDVSDVLPWFSDQDCVCLLVKFREQQNATESFDGTGGNETHRKWSIPPPKIATRLECHTLRQEFVDNWIQPDSGGKSKTWWMDGGSGSKAETRKGKMLCVKFLWKQKLSLVAKTFGVSLDCIVHDNFIYLFTVRLLVVC